MTIGLVRVAIKWAGYKTLTFTISTAGVYPVAKA